MEGEFDYDTEAMAIADMKDRLSKFDQPLNPFQYVKFVVLNWFMDQHLEVQLNGINLPLFGNVNALPWREVNNFSVFLVSNDPSVPEQSMELIFEEKKEEHKIITTLKTSEVQVEMVTNDQVVPTYDPKADHDEEVLKAIMRDCQVFLDKIITPYRVGEQ